MNMRSRAVSEKPGSWRRLHPELPIEQGPMNAHHEPPNKVSVSSDRHGDFLTRYFLRRLAMARRKPLYSGDSGAAHWDALVEVIFIAVAAPFFAAFSFLLILSVRWLTPSQAASLPIPSKYAAAIGGWIACVIVGRSLLSRKFKRFLTEPGAALLFDTERDRQIANGLKLAVIAISGFLVPAVGFLIAFWDRL